MKTQSYDMEVMAQANSVLTRSNTAVMAQLAHITVTMNGIQAQLKTLAYSTTNQTRFKINYHCCSCGSNYTHGSKT